MITTDAAYDDVLAGHSVFVQRLGELVFLEAFRADDVDGVCFTFADGVEGELVVGRQSRFRHMHVGPFKVLLDPTGLLAGAVFPLPTLGRAHRLRRYAALLFGSGMTSATMSSRRWHVDSCGRPMAVWRTCDWHV